MNPFEYVSSEDGKIASIEWGNPWTSERWWTWNISWQMIIICTKQSRYIKYLSYITCSSAFQSVTKFGVILPMERFQYEVWCSSKSDQAEKLLQVGAYTRDNINDNRILSRHAVLILAALLNHNDSHWSFSYGFEWALWCSSLSYSNIINRTRGYK